MLEADTTLLTVRVELSRLSTEGILKLPSSSMNRPPSYPGRRCFAQPA